jgi:hypothetical protein
MNAAIAPQMLSQHADFAPEFAAGSAMARRDVATVNT